jgi:putative sterol carrier protein
VTSLKKKGISLMVKFPSDEWIQLFKDKLNRNANYEKVAKDWEGDFLFVILPDDQLEIEVKYYMDLYHGKCREAYRIEGHKETSFTFSGPYSNWKKLIKNELDPIKGFIRGLFTINGDSLKIFKHINASKELINTAGRIPTEF